MSAADAAPSGDLLVVTDVHGGYGQVKVLHGIELRVAEGEVVVILGANGAGKTTTLRAICGMLAATGRIEFSGEQILGRQTERIVRLGMAQVPQGRGTFVDLTVEDNLRLGAYIRNDRDVHRDIEDWFEVFPRLGERRNQVAGSMSGGEQQMLAIARALMSNPRLLLLDEPSLGLAPKVTQELFDRLAEINEQRGTTMLVVEQNANLALAIADRGYVLETGRIVESGTAHDLRTNESVRKAYLGY
jgi:branched-chain amino acid transport system ATP-binding protein